jgi:hypothetical protein
MLDLPTIWRNVLDASGLDDAAQEYYGHDLLDGIEDAAHGAPLEYTFLRLCQAENVQEIVDVECVLRRMRTLRGFEGLHLPDAAIELACDSRDGPAVGICDHTSMARQTYSDRWGTPREIIQLVVDLYGPISLDLASDDEHQDRLRDFLEPYYTQYTAARSCPLCPPVQLSDVVWCNPPGPRWRAETFWAAWLNCIERGAQGGFLIFKQDYWRALQSPTVQCTAVVLRKRLKFARSAAEVREAQRRAEALGKRYAPNAGANFPSTLILSGRLEGERLYQAQKFGHTLYWG